MRLSLTSIVPSTIMPSAQICLPDERIVMSSMTISSMAISISSPSRTTFALGAERRDNLSIVRFERMPCTIPQMQLPMMRIIKPKLPKPAMVKLVSTTVLPSTVLKLMNVKNTRITAKATKTKLKNVKMFSRRICGIDLVFMVCSPLILPSATRVATS